MKNFYLTMVFAFLGIANLYATIRCEFSIFSNGGFQNPQTTVWGKTCADLKWFRPDGSQIPSSEIRCCDFDDNGLVVGDGINCPFLAGTLVTQEDWDTFFEENNNSGNNLISNFKKTYRTSSNFILSKNLIAGINNQGFVTVFDPQLNINIDLINITKQFKDKTIKCNFERIGDDLLVHIVPMDNKISILDDAKIKTFTYNISSLKHELMKNNILNFVNIYPNPISKNQTINFNITKAIKANKYEIIDFSGNVVKSGIITEEIGLIQYTPERKGIYFYVIFVDNVAYKAGTILVE